MKYIRVILITMGITILAVSGVYFAAESAGGKGQSVEIVATPSPTPSPTPTPTPSPSPSPTPTPSPSPKTLIPICGAVAYKYENGILHFAKKCEWCYYMRPEEAVKTITGVQGEFMCSCGNWQYYRIQIR